MPSTGLLHSYGRATASALVLSLTFVAGCAGGVDDSDGTLEVGADATGLVGQLLTVTSKCAVASKGKYSTDDGERPSIDICRLNGAFFWKSDMDIDCDGQRTTQCNEHTDDAYQNQTSFDQSNGRPLNAAKLPYVVVPLPSSRFNYEKSNIKPGAVAAVIFNGKINFGVFGDEGPDDIIGEASYAMAKSLGINPDPNNGGTDSGVTFIVFTGNGAVVAPIEGHDRAVSLGNQLANQLVQRNLSPLVVEPDVDDPAM
jgi:hypothetical protein